ncbi:MAG: serine kinase [Cereibacter sphaeroides]|uniref:Serine kinase n=1 Tax=Cereibacter sphaeroides TaxID=1063 RepID=A0A2W5S850_CERSP|nr:MAG: serine kinase [Cereibacter sphaeroides]
MTGALTENIHASCVAAFGRGLLILGPSGSGKSSLALQLIGLGASLVADDRVDLSCRGTSLFAQAPATLEGRIEARGIGILRAEAIAETELHLAVQLSEDEGPRLPDWHEIVFMQRKLNLVRVPLRAHLAASLLLYLRGGRAD